MRTLSEGVRRGAGPATALGGTALAVLGPAAWFAWFAREVVDLTVDPFSVSIAQRVIAVAGAVVGGATIAELATRTSAGSVGRVPRHLLMAAAGPFAALVAVNMLWTGVLRRWWSLPLSRDVFSLADAARAVLGATVIVALGGLLRSPATRPAEIPGLLIGSLAGASYGSLSALWHCCPPLWWSMGRDPHAALTSSVTLLWAVGSLGFVSAVSTRQRAGAAELTGGALLALGYPYHSPLWALQCFAGGAFCAWMSRRTGSVGASAMFLVAAYTTHMTLPFLGGWGAAAALLLAVLAVLRLVPHRHPTDRGRR